LFGGKSDEQEGAAGGSAMHAWRKGGVGPSEKEKQTITTAQVQNHLRPSGEQEGMNCLEKRQEGGLLAEEGTREEEKLGAGGRGKPS